MHANRLSWAKSIQGFLLDINGVLYISDGGAGKLCSGSIEAVNR